jgi:predicted SAM-dependent methyltransferase
LKKKLKLKTLIRKARFWGSKYYCPMCDSNLRELRPYGFKFPVLTEKNIIGGGYRLNVQCPICKSKDRERLLYLYLSKKTKLLTEQVKLLHVAPEPALSAFIKQHSNIDYLTADISSNSVMVKMDITEIEYPEKSFDVIICNHVLEHIIDDGKAMSELYRVLKSGGWGILQVPISLSLDETYEDFLITDPTEREQVFGQSDHVRIYAMDFLDRLKKAGFQVNPFEWWADKEFTGSSNKHGLLQDEYLFVVSKSE